MSTYLNSLKDFYDSKTFKRKVDYIDFNFSHYIKRDSTILEIGPGMGEFIHYANKKKIFDIDIVDNDQNILRHIRKNFRIKRAFFSNNLKKIDKNLRFYDLIFLTQVLEHIPKPELVDFIKILFKHVKPLGRIIITVPNGANPLGLVERYYDLQHELVFTERSFIQLLNQCKLGKFDLEIRNYKIPLTELINIPRTLLQAILHFVLKLSLIINGGVYLKHMHPNIVFIIRKTR